MGVVKLLRELNLSAYLYSFLANLGRTHVLQIAPTIFL